MLQKIIKIIKKTNEWLNLEREHPNMKNTYSNSVG